MIKIGKFDLELLLTPRFDIEIDPCAYTDLVMMMMMMLAEMVVLHNLGLTLLSSVVLKWTKYLTIFNNSISTCMHK